jgi:hypothetical protein
VNFYPFHLGDYVAHTAHLDPLEDIAYRRLLDLYYQREAALVGSAEQLARMIRMREYEEIVARVLTEFFEEHPNAQGALPTMWRNRRADIEIDKYRSMKAGGKKGAEKRWGKKSANPPPAGSAGGPGEDPLKGGEIPGPIPPLCPPHSGGESVPNANQEPRTKNQEDSVDTLSQAPPLPRVREADPRQPLYAPSIAGRVCWAMKAAGVRDVNPSHAVLLELIDVVDVDVAEFASAAQEAASRGKGFAYALGIVQGRRRDSVKAAGRAPLETIESFRERDRRLAAERAAQFAPDAVDRAALVGRGPVPPIVIDVPADEHVRLS